VRVFYGWWIVAAGFVLQGLSGGLLLNAFGAYFVHLQQEFGWSRTAISAAPSMGRFEAGIIGPAQGWLIQRLGGRAVIRIGILVFGGGFIALSFCQDLTQFYAAYLVLSLGAGLGGFLTVNIILANWFERKRASAIGISALGQSVAGVATPLVALVLNGFGWRATAFASGILILLLGLPAAQVFRQAPEPYGLAPDGVPPRDRERRAARGLAASPTYTGVTGLTARQALATSAFWLLTLGHSAALASVTAVLVHLIPYLVQFMGLSLEVASSVVPLITALSIVGQLGGGILGDRLDKRLFAAACMAGHTLAMLGLVVVGDAALVFLCAGLHGLAWGARGPLMMSVRADYFGRRAFATIEGFAAIVTMLGLVVGPMVVGFLADTLGDYRPGFLCLAGVTGAGIFFFWLAPRPRIPRPSDTESQPVP
jgi:MFS family permease